MALSQTNRFLNLTTPLGKDVLLLTSFSGNEEMSRLFTYDLELISDNNAITAADIVGKNVTFSVELADESRRFFNGVVSRFIAGADDSERRRSYRIEVVPWLWLLTHTADCRIFQDVTVPEIIEQILSDLGFSDYELQISMDHKTWEYCVQYRETDFNFISRLMEQEGIFYYFKHEEGKHTLVMADHMTAYSDCPENHVNLPVDYSGIAVTDHLFDWEHHYTFLPGKWAQTDFDFKKPSTSLMTETDTVIDLPEISKYEVYDYPGEYVEKSDGETETRIRMEEEETPHNVVHGSGNCKTFTVGGKFSVGMHPSDDEEGKSYAITAIMHSATETMPYETGTGPGPGEFDYTNSFSCIPDDVTFRPARITPRPLTSGVQTAIVVGPAGEEIYTDEYGRVKVQFHWDREGKKDENSSCWIRVSQNWAGEKWGIVFHPRIGQEVIVDFVQGDPDRPIITGRVYNAEQMPPYDLPGEQTKSTVKTRSSKGGGPANFNEIRFEDKKGSEELYIHAEKDRNDVVENNHTQKVGVDQTIEIGNNQFIQIGEPVVHSADSPIQHSQYVDIKKDRFVTIREGLDNLWVQTGGQHIQIEKGQEFALVGGDRNVVIERGNDSLEISMGNRKTKLNLGKSETEAMQSIELKVGQSSIKIDQMGVTIKGMMVKIEGTIMTQVTGVVTKVEGTAMLKLGGGAVMIG